MRILPYLRLFRISVAFTPIADVTAGFVLAARGPLDSGDLTRLVLASLASTAAFCFGTGLNDYLDRHKDRKLAPERPIPSGTLTPARALTASTALCACALGLAACCGLDTLIMMVLVISFVAAYDLFTRRSDAWGIINLALIRALDVMLGMTVANGGFPTSPHSAFEGGLLIPWVGVGLYGVYAFFLSFTALGERGQRSVPSTLSAWGAVVAAGIPLFLLPERNFLIPGIVLWLVLALPVYRHFDRKEGGVERVVGHLVSGYFLVAALLVLIRGEVLVCIALWALHFISRGLSRKCPPA